MEKVYIKSLEDEIDWKIIDQLHSATMNNLAASGRGISKPNLFYSLQAAGNYTHRD